MTLNTRANGHTTLLLVALFLKIHKNISTERCKMKLGELFFFILHCNGITTDHNMTAADIFILAETVSAPSPKFNCPTFT